MSNTDQRKVQLGVEVDASRARTGFDQVKVGAKDMAQAVAQSGQQAGKGLDGIGSSSEAAAAKLERDTRSMIASVQRTTAAMEAAGKGKAAYFEELSKQRGLDANAIRPYLDELRKAEAAQQAASGSLNKMGISAAQTAAAMRQVPAQFTDIITSLQGGQAPMTVLLQQGGQLKDMFGGVGNAARAMGGYVAGMVSPISLVVAGLGAVAYGFTSGRSESSAFNQAVIATGGIADVTSGQLTAMAASMASVHGNQSKASDALVEFVKVGGVGAQQLQRFTQAAVQLESVGGPAIAETAKAFAELADAPVEASIKLNKAMNYLTATTYEQIKSLDEQGKHTDAARVAQEAYASALEDRTPQMLQNLGLLEQAWIEIKGAISGAGSALANIGRGQTPQEQLAAVQASIANKSANLKSLQGGLLGVWLKSDIEQLRQQESYLRERIRLEQLSSGLRADQAAQAKALIQWDKDGEQFVSKKLRMEQEIAKARQEGLAAKRSEADIEARVNAIREKYTEKKEYRYSDNGTQRAYLGALEEMDRLQRSATASVLELSKSQEALRKVMESPEWALFSRRKQEEIIMAAANAQAAENEAEAHKQAQKAMQEVTQAREAEVKKVQSSTASMNEKALALEDEVALYGMSEAAINALTVARLREEQAKQMSYGDEQMVAALQAEIDATERLAKAKDALSGKNAAAKAAKDAEEAWKRASEKIESSITDALMRGFESGKGFAENLRDVVVNMFKTMVLRPVVEFGVRGGLSVLGMGGMAGPASAADMMGGLGSLGSGMSTLSGLGGWFTDFGGSVTASIDKIGRSVADLSEISGSYGATVDSIGTSIQSSASAIGQAATYVGYAVAAVSAIDAASRGQWGKAIGTGVGAYFGGPIGAAIGGAVGGWVDDAFGGGHEYTTGTGISGHFSGKQFAGRNYQDWRNDGSSGLFGIGASGSSSGTNYSAMDAAAQKGLGSAYGKLLDQTAQFTKALGGNADAILGYQKDIKLALGSDVEANKQAIAAMFKGIANEVASTVVDAQYIREGEGAADTLARLATNLTVVNGSLDMLDANLLSVGQASGDAASSLVDSFGGLQQYQSAIGTYYLRFYSQEERLAKTREQLNKQFGDLGLSVPSTIEAYRNLVNAQDLSTEAGRKNYEALISMSSAFADITDAAAAAQVKLTDVAKTLDSMVKDIASARTSVASARNQVSPAPVMGLDAIRAGVLAATSSADTSAMVAAGNVLGQKQNLADHYNALYQNASAIAAPIAAYYASLQDENSKYVNDLKAAGTEIHAIASSYGVKLSSVMTPTNAGLNNDAYLYDAGKNRLNNFAAYTSWGFMSNPDGMNSNARFQELNALLGQGNYKLQQYEYMLAAAKSNMDNANAAVANGAANKAAADLEAQKAAQDYAKAVNDWTVEASKSVPALEKLRDETMRYYESQKALAEGMVNSSANLRSAVASLRATQLDPRAAAQQQLREFDKNYTMALSTQGFEKAAYADKLAAALPALSDAIKATSSNADWVSTMARLSAQSSAIADQLDASAPKNYQAESLGLLDNIDSALGVLDDSTRAITRAIDASGSVTAQGLRAVVVALGGTPAFASGGYHSGGLRLVGENGPELEVTGPSRIFSAAQTRNILAGGGSTERLEALVEKQAQQLEALRAELRAIAAHTANTAENTRSMDRHGVMVWTDPAAPIDTKVAA